MNAENEALFPDFAVFMSSRRNEEARAVAERMTGEYKEFAMIYLLRNSDPFAAKQAALLFNTENGYLLCWKYFTLGTLSIMFGTLEESEAYFSQAIEYCFRPGFLGWICVNWSGGIVERNTDNDPVLAERALEIATRGVPFAASGTLVALKVIQGNCYKSLGRYDEAIAIIESSIDPLNNQLMNAKADSDIGDVYRLKGDAARCLFYTRRAWATAESLDILAYDRVGILNRLALAEHFGGNFDQALVFAKKAIASTESSRATIIEQRDRIAYFGLLRSCYELAISCLLKIGEYELAFDYTERSRAREISGSEPIQFSTDALPDDLAVVSYYIVEGRLWAFVLNQGGIGAIDLCPVEDVTNVFDNTGYPRNLLPGAGGKLRKAFVLEKLADLIARPLAHLTSNYDRLCLIPYGPLHHMPITIMFQNEHVFVSPSLTMIKSSRPRNSSSEVFAVGYNDSTLIHAEAEAQAVGDFVYVGADATRDAILEGAQGAGFLHISAHGFFDQKDPYRSYVKLFDGNLYADDIAEKLKLNSAVVVLSSCDSGRSKVQAGDEPFGLIRAFMKAGARKVICALWPVDEVATRLLMEHFYTNIKAGMKASKAIRQAQATIRALNRAELSEQLLMPGIPKGASAQIVEKTDDDHPFAHPYWWAGFVVVGDEFTK